MVGIKGQGSGRRFSEEHKRRISVALMGHKINNGRKHSAETRARMSVAQTGLKKPNLSKAMRGRKLSKEHIEKIRIRMKGRVVSPETRLRMSRTHLGVKVPKISVAMRGRKLSEERKRSMSLARKGSKSSDETKRKISLAGMGRRHTMETRKRMSIARLGENSPNWQGGITPIHEKVRKSLEYRLWREAVFKRDDWTCLWCKQRGGKLNADHIKQFAYHPELRFELSNGRTLCIPCHRKTDTWGWRGIKRNVVSEHLRTLNDRMK